MNHLERKGTLRRMPWLVAPLQVAICGFLYVVHHERHVTRCLIVTFSQSGLHDAAVLCPLPAEEFDCHFRFGSRDTGRGKQTGEQADAWLLQQRPLNGPVIHTSRYLVIRDPKIVVPILTFVLPNSICTQMFCVRYAERKREENFTHMKVT